MQPAIYRLVPLRLRPPRAPDRGEHASCSGTQGASADRLEPDCDHRRADCPTWPNADLEEEPPVYDKAWGSAGIRSMGVRRPSARASSNASSGVPWTACCPDRSAMFWGVRRSSGCGSLSSSTSSTSELRYEHGRDS